MSEVLKCIIHWFLCNFVLLVQKVQKLSRISKVVTICYDLIKSVVNHNLHKMEANERLDGGKLTAEPNQLLNSLQVDIVYRFTFKSSFRRDYHPISWIKRKHRTQI